MGMTNWSGDRLLKKDVGTAKNYLTEKEIDMLNRIVVMFLDRAEFRAMRRQDILINEWEKYLDKFLDDNDLPVLKGSGTISHKKAIEWAEEQYDEFDNRRHVEMETEAEKHYLDDLNKSAETIENDLKQKNDERRNNFFYQNNNPINDYGKTKSVARSSNFA